MTTEQEKPASDTQWSIQALDQPNTNEAFAITDQHYVGRKDCEIVLFDPHSSRQHAKLSLDDGQLRLDDLDSANGTFVNETRIQSILLNHGDTVRFDQQEFSINGPQDTVKTMLRLDQATTDIPAKSGDQQDDRQIAIDESLIEAANSGDEESERLPSSEPAFAAVTSIPDLPVAVDAERTKKMSHNSNAEDLKDLVAESELKRSKAQSGQDAVPSLVIMTGELMGKSIPLNSDIMTIGRIGVEIPLDETSVSTKHAQVIKQGGKWKVVDLMSANGVFINGKKTQSAFLIAGDIIRIGRVELRFTNAQSKPRRAQASGGTTQNKPRNNAQFYDEANVENKLPGWLYVALGFGIALAVGAYIMSSI